MRRRVGDVLGWSGVAMLVGALILTTPQVVGFSEHTAPAGQDLALLIGPTLLLAAAVLGWVSLTTTRDPDWLTARPSWGGVLGRGAVVLAAGVVVWAAFPTRHLALSVDNDRFRMFPDEVIALWAGVCLVALGTALVLGAATALPWHRWKRVLTGVVAGALGAALVWTLVPAAMSHLLMVEHTVAAADGGQAAPVPATISRVGWTWQPEHPVLGVERGPRGPLVRHADGFVALDGATGEELWTYRLPYARQVQTGVFAGQDRYAYLSHVAHAEPEPETRTLVVLDAATGQVVRDAPMPRLAWEGQEEPPPLRYLTPDVRVFFVYEDERPLVVAYATDSTERLWEVELEDGPGERVCLWADDDGIRGHGDRVLVARLCLDQEHIPDQDVEASLWNMDVPPDAVESVTALEVSTGEQVWRQEWTPQDLPRVALPGVSTVRDGDEGRPIARTPGGVFALDDGAPAQVLPAAAQPTRQQVVAADTAGAVVLRDQGGEEPALLLVTDAAGEVIQRTEVEVDANLWAAMDRARVVGSMLAVPQLSYDDADRKIHSVAVWSWEGEAARQGWTHITLGGAGEVWEADDAFSTGTHEALPVPGAVVAYAGDLYGLVP